LEEMISEMKISFNENELLTEIGNNRVIVPYTVESETGEKVIIRAQIEGEEVKLTFSILSNNLMMFTSDATDDMDYYVWKRAVDHKV
jgi:hypothetical protein